MIALSSHRTELRCHRRKKSATQYSRHYATALSVSYVDEVGGGHGVSVRHTDGRPHSQTPLFAVRIALKTFAKGNAGPCRCSRTDVVPGRRRPSPRRGARVVAATRRNAFAATRSRPASRSFPVAPARATVLQVESIAGRVTAGLFALPVPQRLLSVNPSRAHAGTGEGRS